MRTYFASVARRWLLILFAWIFFSGLLPAADSLPKTKPTLLYSRYFSAPGGERYSPDGAYKEVMERLGEEFDVRIHKKPLTPKTLAGVKVVFIANPGDKAVGTNAPPPHFSPGDIKTLARFVEQGGGFIIMGNQENHNLEVEDTNKLLARFGLQFTNLFTDFKKLALPTNTQVIGGLRWAYYGGNLLTLDTNHPAKPRGLIRNDLTQKPINGPRDQAGVLLAVSQPGRGRVVAVTDAGWIGNAALNDLGGGATSLQPHDNWEIFRRLARWAAQGPADPKSRESAPGRED